MSTTVGAPPPRDYGQETRDTLQAQLDLAPSRYAAEAQFQPQYTALNLQNLNTSLNGSPDTPGLLSLYENSIQPALSRVATADLNDRVAGEVGVIQKHAGDVTRTLRDASGNAPLIEELNRQAMADLQSGAGLDPSLAGEVQQGVRAAQASRGFGFGAPDAVAEAFARGSRGVELRNQRRQFAGNVVGLNQATGGDPCMAILGRPSQTMGMGQNLVGQGGGLSAGTQFNPESGYAQDLFNTNFNAKAAQKIAQANNDTAITAAGIGAAGSAASAL